MDFTTIAPYITSIATAFIAWFAGRKMSASQVDNSQADYAAKVIENTEKLTAQQEAQIDKLQTRLNETETYSKEQREQKRKFRDENNQLKASLHDAQLKIKDLEHDKSVLEMTRCTVFPCTKAVPPRPHNKPAKPEGK